MAIADNPSDLCDLAHITSSRTDEKKNYPESWHLPVSAIDTDDLPHINLADDSYAGAPDDHPLPAYRLDDSTWMLYGNIDTLNEENRGFNANAGFIITGDGVIVIDTLGTPQLGRRMISTIRCITEQPIRYLIVTHNHPDHAYGAAAFQQLPDITIIAHKGTIDYNRSDTLQTSVNYRREMLPRDMQGFKPVSADEYISAGPYNSKRITLGDEIVDVYDTGQHHSYGDLVVHQVNQKILWISDLACNQRTTYMGDGHSAQILDAQHWLVETFPDTRLMVPGHGSAQSPPFSMVTRTGDYVSRMRDVMKKAVEDGTGMFDAVQQAEFDEWKDVPLYESNQKANANFVYREMEKAYFDDF